MPNGSDDRGNLGDSNFRLVSAIALVLGASSGGYNLWTAPDRYSAAEAAIQAERVIHLQSDVDRLRAEIERIDRNGPLVGNRGYSETLKDHEKRLDKLERK